MIASPRGSQSMCHSQKMYGGNFTCLESTEKRKAVGGLQKPRTSPDHMHKSNHLNIGTLPPQMRYLIHLFCSCVYMLLAAWTR